MRSMAPHGHLFFELIVVTSGNGRHIVDGLDHEAVAGTVFVLPPGSIHDLRSFADADGWAILFQTDSVDPDSPHGLAPIDNLPVGLLFDLFRQPVLQMLRPIQLDAASLAQVTGLIGRMHDELNVRQEGYAHAARAALQLLLVTLARTAPWLEMSVADIAQALGYAEVESFIRRFRLHHEFTPSAWRERSRTPVPRESEFRTVKTQP